MNYEKKFLTVKETAEYLGSTMSGIWKMAHEKRIRYYKPNGGKLYFALTDIEEYIMSGEMFEPKPKEIKD